MFKISNTTIATPSSYNVAVEDIDKAERNSQGTMIIENITTKRKLQLEWAIITKAELQQLLGLVQASRFVEVEYLDPETQVLTTGTFYSANKNVNALPLYTGGSLSHWQNWSLSLIEK